MPLTPDQLQSDRRKMQRFICDRIPPDGTRIVLAAGGDGPAWADLIPLWDADDDCDLLLETNEPEWVGLREVYEHFRWKEMTWTERNREIQAELDRAKIWMLEREIEALRSKGSSNKQADADGSRRADQSTQQERIAVQTPPASACQPEQYMTLTEAAKLIPGRRPGKRVSLGTLWRWCMQG